MMQKKILYLSYDGISDPLGRSQILPYIIGLSEDKNLSFTIISFEKNKNFLSQKLKIESILIQHQINWIPLNYTKRPPILSTLWDLIKLNKQIKKLAKESIDLIHCRSHITSLVALKFKQKHNIPFIFDMRGFYADERVDGKIWNKEHFIFKKVYNFFKKKEREFIHNSDHIVSLTSNGKKEIESWGIENQSPITVIPCCTDENLFHTDNIKNVKNELNIQDNEFVISYVGSIGTWYMLDEMLDFFKLLKEKKNNSKFLFITKDDPQLIIKKSREKQIDENDLIIQPSSREMMPSYIAASNFSIFFILPVFSKKASSPTKMGEIMNLGIPLICNSGVGDVDEIMEQCIPELLIKEFTKEEYNRAIDLITNKYKVDRDKIINTSNQYYSLEKGVEKYKEIYNKILN